jgi:hypothetical protein
LGAAAALFALLVAAVIDQQPPHRLRSKREAMSSTLPFIAAIVLKAHPGLVNQRRWLKRMVPTFPAQIAARHTAQFTVD